MGDGNQSIKTGFGADMMLRSMHVFVKATEVIPHCRFTAYTKIFEGGNLYDFFGCLLTVNVVQLKILIKIFI